MELSKLKNQIQDLGKEIKTASTALASAAMDKTVSMEDVKAKKDALADMQTRMAALQESFTVQSEAEADALPAPNAEAKKTLSEMRKAPEYARASAYAIRNGLTPGRSAYDEKLKVLYDALTIGGGDPTGEDGGFLVPEDVDNQIKEISRTLNPLAPLFEAETVGTNSGWRVKDTAPTAGMANVDEMGAIQEGEAPTFSKVLFTLEKYGMYLPVSKELAADEVANLFAYLSRWFAKKMVITENTLLLAELDDLTATAIPEKSELKGIKAVLNKVLDPAISVNARILTNQDGFDVLDNLTDGNGRPLLDIDPNGIYMLRKIIPVSMVSNSVLPTSGSAAPVYIGDFKQYATLYQRNAMEVVSTDIGGNAFRSDSIEVRGIKRMDVSQFDSESVALRTVTEA